MYVRYAVCVCVCVCGDEWDDKCQGLERVLKNLYFIS